MAHFLTNFANFWYTSVQILLRNQACLISYAKRSSYIRIPFCLNLYCALFVISCSDCFAINSGADAYR